MKQFSKLITESKTAPWYKRGEVLVCFKQGIDPKVVSYFLKKLKIESRKSNGKDDHPSLGIHNMTMDDVYIIKVPLGKEDEYIHKLKSELGKDIEWADRRDIKMELRSYTSDYCSQALGELSETADMSDSEWKSKHEELINLMKLISEDNYESIRGMYSEFDQKFKEI